MDGQVKKPTRSQQVAADRASNNRQKPEIVWRPSMELGDALPVMLLRAREAVMEQVRPLLRQHGLTEQQWRVLRALYAAQSLEGGELARLSVLRTSSLSRITNQLGRAGYVRRVRDSSDQRRALFSLTKKGRDVCQSVGPEMEKNHRSVVARLPNTEIADLYRELNELIERLSS